jgi:HD-GYP domain-containing protein (c-di-GMP phosphodiesterase class II)
MSSDPPSDDRSFAAEPAIDAAAARQLGLPLLAALEEHLPGARQHGEATSAYAFATAADLGLGRERAELVREISKLHDVGMVYVPVEVLRTPIEALDQEQRAQLDAHIEAGARLARGAGLPAPQCEWILHTRERWDGDGPERLTGEMIPLEARVIRVACAADLVLASAGFDPTTAALRAAAGAELDPRVAGTMIGVLERTAQTKGPAR